MAIPVKTNKPANSFWPWRPAAAAVAVPIVLLVLFTVLTVGHTVANWPSQANEGVVLASVFFLALFPVILVLLDRLSDGGKVKAFGVILRFPSPRPIENKMPVSPRLGVPPGEFLSNSHIKQILDTLQNASANDVSVVDLGKGTDWWETRLLLLCAGADKRRRPAAIVFVATEHTRPGVFKGWASPAELVQQLLACREDFRDPYNRAYEQALPSPQESREQVLADNLGQIEINKGHGVITVRRLSELFGPVLRTNSFDVDQKKGNDRWTRAVLRTTDQFIAVTRGHNYAGLLPRDEAVNDIIRTLIDTVSGRATATRKTRS